MAQSFVRGAVFLAILLGPVATPTARSEAPAPEEGRLRREVATLASPEFGGRRGEGGVKTAAHLVAAFRDLTLEPLFDGEYTQSIPGNAPGVVQGRNVAAR